MKKGREIYSFTAEQIRYIKKVKATGRISSPQGDQVQDIIRKQVNPRFNMCTTCPGTVSKNFSKIVAWIELFIGCEINDFTEEKCEGLLEEGEERIGAEDKTIEQAKADDKKEKEDSYAEEAKRREERDTKAKAAQKRRTDKRKKKREELEESRREKFDKENERLAENRKKEAGLKSDAEGVCKKAVVILLTGEHNLLVERAAVEAIGSAIEIIEHVETTTGIKIDIDPKSKQAIINEALGINRRIADYARNNSEEVDGIEAGLKLEKQAEAKLVADELAKEKAKLAAEGTDDNYDKLEDKELKELCDVAEIKYTDATKPEGLIKKLRLYDKETVKTVDTKERKEEETVVEKAKSAAGKVVGAVKEVLSSKKSEDKKEDKENKKE